MLFRSSMEGYASAPDEPQQSIVAKRAQHYGLTTEPPEGAEVITLAINGGASNRVAIAETVVGEPEIENKEVLLWSEFGQRVYLDGPYGAFTTGNPADMHVLVAGGIGVTPMMSMIRTLADQGDRRPVILLYGSKDWESVTFREELETLKTRLDLEVVHVLQNPPPGWTGESGFLNAEIFRRHLPAPYADHEYFICGPNVMMDAIEKALGDMHVPISKYHSERYSFA